MKKKTIIISVILLALLVGGWYGYNEYTRKVKSLDKVKADYSMNDLELIRAFEQNESSSNDKYLGKIISVTGNLKKVESNDVGNLFLVLGKEGSLSTVRCSMDSSLQDEARMLKPGNSVTVKGACTGFTSDELLGSDVILNRCVLVNE